MSEKLSWKEFLTQGNIFALEDVNKAAREKIFQGFFSGKPLPYPQKTSRVNIPHTGSINPYVNTPHTGSINPYVNTPQKQPFKQVVYKTISTRVTGGDKDMEAKLMNFIEMIMNIESGRLDRSKETEKFDIDVLDHDPMKRIEATVNTYTTKITLNVDDPRNVWGATPSDLHVDCTCIDFQKYKNDDQPCKHILRLAQYADEMWEDFSMESKEEDIIVTQESFREHLGNLIGNAIRGLSHRVTEKLSEGEVPFLIGPTGVGKTSAVRMAALENGWKFEEIAGCESFADADLVGLKTDHMNQPGVFARAFKRARDGETILLFLDEMLRFNVRAQDLLMRPVQRMQKEIAVAMGLAVETDVYLVEAPMWGVEWAPADNIHFVLAANPWGSSIDPALARRTYPMLVEMDESVLQPFNYEIADAIRSSWKSAQQGELPLPMEYQLLMSATGPDDTSIFRRYLHKVQVIDDMAADGFRNLIEGVGIQLNDK